MEDQGHITISRSALFEQAGGVIRAALYTIGGVLIERGWLNDGLVQALVPLALTAGTLIWQQVRIRYLKSVAVTLADKLPNEIAEAR